MDQQAVVTEVARQLGREAGYELVIVEHSRGRGRWIINIILDRPGGITLQDCQLFSRQLEQVLETEHDLPGPYTLEVASPGLDRVLKHPEEFTYFAGRRVKVTARELVNGRRRWTGEMIQLADGELQVANPKGGTWAIPFDKVAQVRLHADFSKRGQPAGRKHGGREH